MRHVKSCRTNTPETNQGTPHSAILAVWIVICAFIIIFDIVEIVLFARKKLSPVVAVVLNSLTTLAWAVLLIIAAIGAGSAGTGLGLIWLAVIL